MVERCGERQRKFVGLERWPFRLFIEGLPIMLQISLLLLACGLSRYMWSVNTSVARVVISFTVLGVLFYIGIVVAGTSSYECPFQTPGSTALRYLGGSATTRKLLASLSPFKAISLVHATWIHTRPALISASHSVYNTARHPLLWRSHIVSGLHSTVTKLGHQIIILLLRIDRTFGSAKQRLFQLQRARRFRSTVPLPISSENARHASHTPRNGPGLRLPIRNLDALRKQNADNVGCVCWVLRNITDPEAIDSAIRLAGSIRWFDGDPDHEPPFDLIVSTFEACFDSTKQLSPGMRDRAYFSARAILQINAGARVQSREHASKYPIPAVSSRSLLHTDPDLHHVISMLECNFDPGRPTLDYPRGGATTYAHSLWMSNLFVEVTRAGPNPTLRSCRSYFDAAATNHQPTIANTLLIWYLLLGGHVMDETFWAVDKSYVADHRRFFRPLNFVCIRDSLETILSHLSTRVMNVIANGRCLQHLVYLLEFLAAWEERPTYLTPMAHQWCSAISEAGVVLVRQGQTGTNQPTSLQFGPKLIPDYD